MDIEREKLELNAQRARQIIYGDDPEFEIVVDDVIDNTRWSVVHNCVIRRLSDGKLFKDSYAKAATECQSEQPFDYSEPDFREVFAKEKVITIYE